MVERSQLVIVIVRPPPELPRGEDIDQRLARLGAQAIGDGVYLVPDAGGVAVAARALVRDLRRQGGTVLIGPGSLVGSRSDVRRGRATERP